MADIDYAAMDAAADAAAEELMSLGLEATKAERRHKHEVPD